MKIHKEGYTSLFFTLVFVFASIVFINIIWSEQSLVHYIIYSFLGLLFVMILQFFRSPNRKISTDSNIVLCPADGKVVVVEKTYENEYLKEDRIQISVFMSPLNVHSNRYPVTGEVTYFKYHPGKYLVAWHPKSSTDNERTTVVVKHPKQGEILIRQIAGALARRIVCYSKEGTMVNQGEEMGFIKFGSRVDVFLPVDAKILVKPGDVVKSGLTTLAAF
jgi:phosphatidylserine decarboxylase